MSSTATTGVKLKIGADLSELKRELGLVDDTVKASIDPARTDVKGLSRDFNDAASKAHKVSINVQDIARYAVQLGSALTGFTKGLIEEAVKVDPETAANVAAVKDSFASIKTAIVGAIIPLIETWGPKLTTLFQSIAQWVNDNPETAKGLFEVAAAVGGIAVAGGTALPIILELQIALAGVSATALGIAGVVVGAIAILAILSTTLDDIGTKASETAEEIANMDTTTQKIVENGIGELSVVDRDDIDWVAGVWDKELGEFVEGWAYLDENTGQYVLVSKEATAAAAETSEAIATQSTALETTKSASEQATEILEGLQQSMEGVGSAAQEINLSEINSMLESEAFRQFANQPVSEEVSGSWTTFGEAVNNASTGFTTMETSLGEESGLSTALINIQGLLDSTTASAQNLGAYLSGDFVGAIMILMTALCLTSTDEEGNTEAGEGNTLYNSLGAVYGLFCDILATSMLISAHWTTEFVSASQVMCAEAGTATGVVTGLGAAATTAAAGFLQLAAAIYAVIQAYIALNSVKGGGRSSGGGGTNFGGAHASGGPVYAGTTYLVGEEGPELFTPHTNGYIVPNDEISGGKGTQININFNGDVIGDERSIYSLVNRAAKAAIRQEVRAAA